MDDGNPMEPGDKRQDDKQRGMKPYTKPAFRFERVFETQALSCGKVNPFQGICHSNRKSS